MPARGHEPESLDPGALHLGLDLGTSGLKAIALDGSGDVVARARADYPTSRTRPGAAEQDPRDWTRAVEQVAAELASDAPPRRWRAIGLSAMLPTLVTAGADGMPTGPAITWEDSRAEKQARRLRDVFGAAAGTAGDAGLYRTTGQWVDGRYLLPMFLRIADEEPARAARTSTLLGAKDYLFSWLTGQAITDPSTAAGFGCFGLKAGDWSPAVLTAAAETAARDAGDGHGREDVSSGRSACGRLPALPPVLAATATRPLRPEVAARLGCEQLPVCVGAADSVLGALGLGVRSPGQIAYVAGTSTVILGVSNQLTFDPMHRFLVTPLAEAGLWGLEMDLLATGSALRWLAGLLRGGLDDAGVIALAAEVDPAGAPVVLPYLSPGEQGALWDPELRGTIAGLTLGHDRRHLARGLVNGIVLESRRCLAVLDETGPFAADLLVAGGSATAESFRADLADATGRRVIMPAGQDTDFSARGAALLAATAAGKPLPPVREPAAAMISEADPRRAAMWDALWDRHERTRHAVRE
ncbi:MAG TPA: FGGY family carbohydrate kinase [Streptosporangiaceae bacterium]